MGPDLVLGDLRPKSGIGRPARRMREVGGQMCQWNIGSVSGCRASAQAKRPRSRELGRTGPGLVSRKLRPAIEKRRPEKCRASHECLVSSMQRGTVHRRSAAPRNFAVAQPGSCACPDWARSGQSACATRRPVPAAKRTFVEMNARFVCHFGRGPRGWLGRLRGRSGRRLIGVLREALIHPGPHKRLMAQASETGRLGCAHTDGDFEFCLPAGC